MGQIPLELIRAAWFVSARAARTAAAQGALFSREALVASPVMTEVYATVTLNSSTGLAKDRVQNSFTIFGTDSPSTISAAWAGYLVSFYNTVHTPGTTALAGFLSGDLSRSALFHSIKFYDYADPHPRAPYYSTTWSLGALSGTGVNLPKEVAACLSYRATYASGIPPARQRGRLYIGPLNTNVLTGTSTANPTLDTAFQAALRGAGTYLAGLSTAGSKWAVRSRVLGISSEITGGWVDNAFDSQRRRGLAATSRTNWP